MHAVWCSPTFDRDLKMSLLSWNKSIVMGCCLSAAETVNGMRKGSLS